MNSPSLRTGLADFPHPALHLMAHLSEDWRAATWAACKENSPWAAKKALGQQVVVAASPSAYLTISVPLCIISRSSGSSRSASSQDPAGPDRYWIASDLRQCGMLKRNSRKRGTDVSNFAGPRLALTASVTLPEGR